MSFQKLQLFPSEISFFFSFYLLFLYICVWKRNSSRFALLGIRYKYNTERLGSNFVNFYSSIKTKQWNDGRRKKYSKHIFNFKIDFGFPLSKVEFVPGQFSFFPIYFISFQPFTILLRQSCTKTGKAKLVCVSHMYLLMGSECRPH